MWREVQHTSLPQIMRIPSIHWIGLVGISVVMRREVGEMQHTSPLQEISRGGELYNYTNCVENQMPLHLPYNTYTLQIYKLCRTPDLPLQIYWWWWYWWWYPDTPHPPDTEYLLIHHMTWVGVDSFSRDRFRIVGISIVVGEGGVHTHTSTTQIVLTWGPPHIVSDWGSSVVMWEGLPQIMTTWGPHTLDRTGWN